MRPETYGDWPAFLRSRPLVSGDAWTTRVASLLGVPEPLGAPEVRVVAFSEVGGLRTTELSWSVGFGPDLHAWLVSPVGADVRTLPGVLALHSHAGIKSFGAQRLLSGPVGQAYRDQYEDGVSFADHLAARGIAVLAPDTFTWGSRRFDLGSPARQVSDQAELLDRAGVPQDERYDRLAGLHEHLVAKQAGAMGTSYAGMVAHDDLSSLSVLRSLTAGPVSVCGFSGGGGRAITVSALAEVDRVSVTGMMATFESMVPDYLDCHSWLLHTPGLARAADLPDLAANRATQDLQVVYCEHDALFPPRGMEAADARLEMLFSSAPGTYRGVWVPTDHRVSLQTHQLVADFLAG